MTKTSDLKVQELAKLFDNDLDLVQFFQQWLLNGKNATEAYLKLHPNNERQSAQVSGSRYLAKIPIEIVMNCYGLGIDKYMQQLSEGLEAEKRDITGDKYPDHMTRKPYHDKLGKILGIEKDQAGGVAVQVNNFIKNEKQEFGI